MLYAVYCMLYTVWCILYISRVAYLMVPQPYITDICTQLQLAQDDFLMD